MIKKRLTTTLQLGMAVFMMLFATNLVPIAGSVAFADELTDPASVTQSAESTDESTPQLSDTNSDATNPVNNEVTSPSNNTINDNNTPNPLANILNDRLVNEIVVAPNDVCPNVPGDQATVPVGLVLSESGDCHVTICHRDAASNKPYVQITVAVSAVDNDLGNDNGRGDHIAEHTGPVFNSSMQQGDTWGDIIPPVPGIHSGLNWTTEGQAVYNNDCDVDLTSVTPAAVTFNDVCGTEDDTYTIPTTAGVTYRVGGEPKDAGTYAGSGEVTVTATANVGYTLSGATSWSHSFTDEDCPEEDKVTICHRDAAVKKPYVRITVAVSAVDGDQGNNGGQGDHFLEHTGPVFNVTMEQGDTWGDIIPPIPGIHDGLNWSAEGQAIYNNDCAPATVTDVCPNIEGNQTTVPGGLVKVGDNCVVPDNGTVLGVSTVATIIKAPVAGQGQLVDTGENPLVEMLIGLTIFSLAIGSAVLSRKVNPQTS